MFQKFLILFLYFFKLKNNLIYKYEILFNLLLKNNINLFKSKFIETL